MLSSGSSSVNTRELSRLFFSQSIVPWPVVWRSTWVDVVADSALHSWLFCSIVLLDMSRQFLKPLEDVCGIFNVHNMIKTRLTHTQSDMHLLEYSEILNQKKLFILGILLFRNRIFSRQLIKYHLILLLSFIFRYDSYQMCRNTYWSYPPLTPGSPSPLCHTAWWKVAGLVSNLKSDPNMSRVQGLPGFGTTLWETMINKM